jgi:hypothetical protein
MVKIDTYLPSTASSSHQSKEESRESAWNSERETSGAPHQCRQRQGHGHVEGHAAVTHCHGGENSSAWRAHWHMVRHLAGVIVTMLGGQFGLAQF